MKAEDFKSKIQFESRDVGKTLTVITGKLEVRAVITYDRSVVAYYQDESVLVDEIKERIREMILRNIYDDQRGELYEAMMELFGASPLDHQAMDAAREKLLRAAKRQ